MPGNGPPTQLYGRGEGRRVRATATFPDLAGAPKQQEEVVGPETKSPAYAGLFFARRSEFIPTKTKVGI
jgi:hypothetical protein